MTTLGSPPLPSQQGIIRRIESSPPEVKDHIVNRDIPAMMSARNTLEFAHAPLGRGAADIL